MNNAPPGNAQLCEVPCPECGADVATESHNKSCDSHMTVGEIVDWWRWNPDTDDE